MQACIIWLDKETKEPQFLDLFSFRPLVDDTYSASKSYLAPALLADVGVAFGIFRLGVLAWVDKPPSGFTTPSDEPHPVTVGDRSYNLQTPAFALTSGTQFYIGPTLGMELGY